MVWFGEEKLLHLSGHLLHRRRQSAVLLPQRGVLLSQDGGFEEEGPLCQDFIPGQRLRPPTSLVASQLGFAAVVGGRACTSDRGGGRTGALARCGRDSGWIAWKAGTSRR